MTFALEILSRKRKGPQPATRKHPSLFSFVIQLIAIIRNNPSPTATLIPTNPQPDPNSPDCKACSTNLGATDACRWDDSKCLVDVCKADSKCQACKFDCDGLNNGPDYSGPICKACTTTLGASSCKWDDDQCLVDECKADKDCQDCQIPCERYASQT
jgi:hypothetical protein